LISSLERGLPTGPVIVLAISTLTLISLLFAPNRGVVWERIRAQRNRRQLRAAAVLEALYDMALHHGDPLHPHSLRSLQVALPASNVDKVLHKLSAEGLVREISGAWALTPTGVEQVHELLRSARVEGTGDAGMVTA
jgi:manganese/zinc/iron transport system permease protein